MNSQKEVAKTRKQVKLEDDKRKDISDDTLESKTLTNFNRNTPIEIPSTAKRSLPDDYSRPSKIQKSPVQKSPNPQPYRNDANYTVFNNLQDVLKLSPFQQSQRSFVKNNNINNINDSNDNNINSQLGHNQAQQVFLQNISQAQPHRQSYQNHNIKPKQSNRQKLYNKQKQFIQKPILPEIPKFENTVIDKFDNVEPMAIENNLENQQEIHQQQIQNEPLPPAQLSQSQTKGFAKPSLPNFPNQRPVFQNQFKIARPPWYGTRLTLQSTQLIDTLHTEILQFSQYMKPNSIEISLRENVLQRLEEVISKIWQSAKIKLFGSYETKLYLPTSDIDCSIMGQFRIPDDLYTLSSTLGEADLASPFDIKVISTAKVPIVKYNDRLTGIAVDISFNCENGIENSQNVKYLLKEYEVLEPLALVLKYFLSQKQLNETYTGGIGSYALVLMIVAFLKNSPEAIKGNFTKKSCDLGLLLINFFGLFGKDFDYSRIGISHTGEFFEKADHIFQLTIIDPHDPENDVGRGSFRIQVIKKNFEHAYEKLFYGPAQTYYPTKLTRILEGDRQLITCREQYTHTYEKLIRNKIIV